MSTQFGKAITLSAIIGIAPVAAAAEEIEQIFEGAMDALNSLTADAEELGEIEETDGETENIEIVNGEGDGLIDQSGLNAVNLVQVAGDLDTVTQIMDGTQTVSNLIEGTNMNPGTAVTQTGENLANVIRAESIENVAQLLGNGAMQLVTNTIVTNSEIGSVEQVGRNSANVVYADISIGTGIQIIPEDVTQAVHNVLDVSNGDTLDAITQEGVNIGNVLIADHITNVVRVFNGTQIVENTVMLPGEAPTQPISQSGINIANFVSAVTVDNLVQESNGTQLVTNTVLSPTLEELTDEHALISMYSENFVNVLNITSGIEPNDSVSPAVASQFADYNQMVEAGGTHVQVGNAMVVER